MKTIEVEKEKDISSSCKMYRRDFVKYTLSGVAAIAIGSQIPRLFINEAFAAVQTLEITVTDAIKNMTTHNDLTTAQCYFWVYKMKADDVDIIPEVPGPNIFTTVGETINLSIKNELDEPHAFFIPGVFDSGPILPGETKPFSFSAPKAGTFLYYDNLNDPVNRVMGLHGAFIVMPNAPKAGHKFTPYDDPTTSVQQLFDDLGTTPYWPGLPWEQGDSNAGSFTPAFRQYIWILHQASPNLFAEVGSLPPGELYDATQFRNAFLKDPFSPINDSRTPQYFTIDGQAGHFSHNYAFICPNLRVGEPCIMRILNAGLMTHSLHIHANHMFLIGLNGSAQENPLWVDTFTSNPMDIFEWLNPYMRPPDVPNVRGIGLPDNPLISKNGQPIWPPNEEINLFMPAVGTMAGTTPIDVQLSPLCYPMHDHSEPTQTSKGGNYNLGLIAGMNFTGDRNTPGGVTTFPNAPTIFGPNSTGPAAGPGSAPG